jgi:hypothetical protein
MALCPNGDLPRVCPRTGRHPMRRKKNCVLAGFCLLVTVGFLQMISYNEGFSPLRPLADAESEARRLLKFITHYHIQCNSTYQVGNRSHWPICLDKDVGIDLESKDNRIAYTVGWQGDFTMEKSLASNYSFQTYVIAPEKVPQIQSVNNTHTVETFLVPNDNADFSRNLYGQQTINTVMSNLGHAHLSLLRLGNLPSNVQMWEFLHFMISDNLLLKVNQLHIAMYIDKIDEDHLYNWYRALYELFYKQGFRLYHTSSSDSLCLQVTMMESCVYYMAWVKNPGPKFFVVHPPADFGTTVTEEQRLLTYLSLPQVECKQQVIGGGQEEQNSLEYTTPGLPQWQVCSNSIYEIFKKPCSIFRFRSGNDYLLEKQMIKEGCSIHTLEPVLSPDHPIRHFKMHGHYPQGKKKGHRSKEKSVEEAFQILSNSGPISLIEVDVPGHEWDIMSHILDSGILENVTQIVAEIQLSDIHEGKHPTTMRRSYSELRRIEAQGFTMFHSSPSFNWQLDQRRQRRMEENCCFKVGYVKQHNGYR